MYTISTLLFAIVLVFTGSAMAAPVTRFVPDSVSRAINTVDRPDESRVILVQRGGRGGGGGGRVENQLVVARVFADVPAGIGNPDFTGIGVDEDRPPRRPRAAAKDAWAPAGGVFGSVMEAKISTRLLPLSVT